MSWSAAQLARHEARRAAAGNCAAETIFSRNTRAYISEFGEMYARAREDGASFSDQYAHARATRRSAEDQVQLTVVEHLRWLGRPGIVWWHHPAGGWRHEATAARLKRLGASAGLPDLFVLIDGKLHGLELKREHGGRLSPAQIAMHARLRAAGAVVETAAGIEPALATLAAWGALRPADTVRGAA